MGCLQSGPTSPIRATNDQSLFKKSLQGSAISSVDSIAISQVREALTKIKAEAASALNGIPSARETTPSKASRQSAIKNKIFLAYISENYVPDDKSLCQLHMGDLVSVISADDKARRSYIKVNANEQHPMAVPSNILSMHLSGIALKDFETILSGDIITILKSDDKGWAHVVTEIGDSVWIPDAIILPSKGCFLVSDFLSEGITLKKGSFVELLEEHASRGSLCKVSSKSKAWLPSSLLSSSSSEGEEEVLTRSCIAESRIMSECRLGLQSLLSAVDSEEQGLEELEDLLQGGRKDYSSSSSLNDMETRVTILASQLEEVCSSLVPRGRRGKEKEMSPREDPRVSTLLVSFSKDSNSFLPPINSETSDVPSWVVEGKKARWISKGNKGKHREFFVKLKRVDNHTRKITLRFEGYGKSIKVVDFSDIGKNLLPRANAVESAMNISDSSGSDEDDEALIGRAPIDEEIDKILDKKEKASGKQVTFSLEDECKDNNIPSRRTSLIDFKLAIGGSHTGGDGLLDFIAVAREFDKLGRSLHSNCRSPIIFDESISPTDSLIQQVGKIDYGSPAVVALREQISRIKKEAIAKDEAELSAFETTHRAAVDAQELNRKVTLKQNQLMRNRSMLEICSNFQIAILIDSLKLNLILVASETDPWKPRLLKQVVDSLKAHEDSFFDQQDHWALLCEVEDLPVMTISECIGFTVALLEGLRAYAMKISTSDVSSLDKFMLELNKKIVNYLLSVSRRVEDELAKFVGVGRDDDDSDDGKRKLLLLEKDLDEFQFRQNKKTAALLNLPLTLGSSSNSILGIDNVELDSYSSWIKGLSSDISELKRDLTASIERIRSECSVELERKREEKQDAFEQFRKLMETEQEISRFNLIFSETGKIVNSKEKKNISSKCEEILKTVQSMTIFPENGENRDSLVFRLKNILNFMKLSPTNNPESFSEVTSPLHTQVSKFEIDERIKDKFDRLESELIAFKTDVEFRANNKIIDKKNAVVSRIKSKFVTKEKNIQEFLSNYESNYLMTLTASASNSFLVRAISSLEVFDFKIRRILEIFGDSNLPLMKNYLTEIATQLKKLFVQAGVLSERAHSETEFLPVEFKSMKTQCDALRTDLIDFDKALVPSLVFGNFRLLFRKQTSDAWTNHAQFVSLLEKAVSDITRNISLQQRHQSSSQGELRQNQPTSPLVLEEL